jgi:hypothetical protein
MNAVQLGGKGIEGRLAIVLEVKQTVGVGLEPSPEPSLSMSTRKRKRH